MRYLVQWGVEEGVRKGDFMTATGDDDSYGFEWTLAKFVGLNQMLNPGETARACGRNAYHVCSALGMACLLAACVLSPIGFYQLTNDASAFAAYFGFITNFLFACYKMITVLRHSDAIWRLDRIDRRDRAAYRRWSRLARRVSRMVVTLAAFGYVTWMCIPFAFNSTAIPIRRPDGTYARYRMNVFNLYAAVSDTVYNRQFYTFYAAEMVLFTTYIIFITMFDLIIVIVCFALCCRLDVVSRAVRLLGHEPPSSAHVLNINNVTILKEKCDIYEELKIITKNHQNVLKSLNDYYNIFQPAILTEIFVGSSTHVLLWFIAATSIFNGELADSVFSIKLLIALPVFSFNLFIKCYLVGIINEIKDSIIFALYSCNWTEMDIKSKKLILLTMKMNNANQSKIRFTNTKIVNLEMFTQTMRICYSLFSMLIKYKETIN